MLHNDFTSLVSKLNDNRLEWVLDVKNDRLVPDGCNTNTKICLSIRIRLPNLDLVLSLIQVLRVYDVHLQLRVATNTHRCHELALSLHGLLELELNLFLLAIVIDDVAHDFVLSFLQLVLCINILDDKFLDGNLTVVIHVDLIKDLIDDLVAHVFVKDLLHDTDTDVKGVKLIFHAVVGAYAPEVGDYTVTYFHLNKVLVQLRARDDPILVGVNHTELLSELPFHIILKARLLNSLINSVGV